ncbi:GAF and ANTAR domain-containing protein [Rhodococcus sp. NPDC019627]|uniref:GAF and ANTAR domain-containing protein n=1 Tax=unclassified Rhodococcus (in: high G+C Gram-positive bacteria) TaxID=192944 RepID=UPI0033C6242F
MTDDVREELLIKAFVDLGGHLVASDFDLFESLNSLIEHSVALCSMAAAGLVLVDGAGDLKVMASSDENVRFLELLQLRTGHGPCLDTVRSGEPCSSVDLSAETGRWPEFVEHAESLGYHAVYAVPLRWRAETIGAFNLLHIERRELPARDARVARALADLAAIAIVQDREIRATTELNHHLQNALDTRVVIEQAKGALAERGDLELSEAFHLLRAYSRRRRLRLTDVAAGVTDRSIPCEHILQTHRR